MVLDTLTAVVICLGVSFIFSELFFHIKYPRVIGQIITGLILGIPFFSVLFSEGVASNIAFLADLGIIFLLLITGMQINLKRFQKAGKSTVIIALFSIAVPFIMGFVLMKAMGYGNVVGIVTGIIISLTAEGTNLKVLLDMKALNTKVGIYLLGAGILDDVFEVIFLALILILAKQSYQAALLLPFKIIAFVIVVFITYKVIPKVLRLVEQEHSRITTISFIILFSFIMAMISKWMDLGPIIGAFIAGIIIHVAERHQSGFEMTTKQLETITFAFIIPFFFINIGLHVDFTNLTHNIYIAFMVLLVATLGKILGAIAAKPFTDMTLRQAHLLGWGLNSRGAIELVIAEVARANNLIPIEVYSALVLTGIITTLAFPFVMKGIVAVDRKVLTE